MLYDLPKPKEGEVFCEFNVNPKKNLSTDCYIRAVALVFDIPYEKAYRELCNFGIKMSRMLNESGAVYPYLDSKAVVLQDGVSKTVKEFVLSHPKGRFILAVNTKDKNIRKMNHTTCCVDGVIYDIGDTADTTICRAWQVYLSEEELLYDVLIGIKDAATKSYKDNEDCFTALEMKELLNYRRMLERDLYNAELHMEGI